MLKKVTLIILISIAILCFLGSCKDNSMTESSQSTEKIGYPAKDFEKKYELIISSCGKRSKMFSKFRAVSNYLSKSTGLKIEPFIAKNFEELVKKLENRAASFIYFDPAIYLETENYVDKNNLYVFLCGFIDKYKGKPVETGCLIARADSNIKTIKDVKGKRVIFGPKNSATKWIAARRLFTENSINLEKDLAGYSHGRTCTDIVLDIFYKKADVGCVRTLMCPICKPSIYYKNSGLNLGKLVVVAETSPVIAHVFSWAPSVDEKDAVKIVEALAKIPQLESQERRTLPIDIRYGLIKVDDRAFDHLRKMGE